ncbi:PIN domain-containing protein [Halorubrum trueperi]|uniref:Toxin-antitoxin system toxin component, PIN family n=1 Tax=Halorubrum trueperi TaxID=2004704 RepID=A0ABD5UNP1_9EURY
MDLRRSVETKILQTFSFAKWLIAEKCVLAGRFKPFVTRYFSEFVDPKEDVTAVEADPDDDKFLEAAVAGSVDYLVSGDGHLLDLESFRGIDIVEPRTFYDRLNAQ